MQGLVGSIATNQQNKSNKKQAGSGEVEAVHTRKLQPWGQRGQIQDELGDTFLENSDSLLMPSGSPRIQTALARAHAIHAEPAPVKLLIPAGGEIEDL